MRRLQASDEIHDDRRRRKSRRHDPHGLVLQKRVNDIPEIINRRGADLAVAQDRLILLHISEILGDDHAKANAHSASGGEKKAGDHGDRILYPADKRQRQKKDHSRILR